MIFPADCLVQMKEIWSRGGAAGDGDEAGIRGIVLTLVNPGSESLGDSVVQEARFSLVKECFGGGCSLCVMMI